MIGKLYLLNNISEVVIDSIILYIKYIKVKIIILFELEFVIKKYIIVRPMKLFISRYIVADIPPNLLPKKYVSGLIMIVTILPIIRTDVNRINEMIRILLFAIKIIDSGEKSPEYALSIIY